MSVLAILDFIIWDPDPKIFDLGPLEIRWYGLLFALGFLFSQQILLKMYRMEGKPEKDVDRLTIYLVIATIIGARLGHVIFYDLSYYLSNPVEIILINKGGLASHGAAIGIIVAIYIYARKTSGQSFFYVIDRIVILVALAGALIRFGNLMNSEIIGEPTTASYGFVFAGDPEFFLEERYKEYVDEVEFTGTGEDSLLNEETALAGMNMTLTLRPDEMDEKLVRIIRQDLKPYLHQDHMNDHIILKDNSDFRINRSGGTTTMSLQVWGVVRHAAQLYESISTFIIFLLLLYYYYRKKGKIPEGMLFGIFTIWVFTLRFFWEFLKEPQVEFEETMALNMGQILSIPLVIIGILILIWSKRRDRIT